MEADCVSGICPRKVSPGQKFLVAIERESPTTFVRKIVISLLRSITLGAEGISLCSINLEQKPEKCYPASCRQPRLPGH